MHNIYTAMYVCKSIEPVGVVAMLPGGYDVVLGLSDGNGFSDIIVKGTCSRFVVGKEYLINIQELSISGNKWNKPQELSNMDVGFGPKSENGGIDKVLPLWEEIPEDFQCERVEVKKWIRMVNDMFFSGVELNNIVMKEGIDQRTAMKHLQCILHSYEPSHERKTAGAAYLMSLWFEKFEYKKVEREKV